MTEARFTGRQAFVATPFVGDNYNVLATYSLAVGAELERRGWTVTHSRSDNPGFLNAMLRVGADPEAIVLLGHFFYDLRVSAQNLFNGTHLGDLIRARKGAMIADHPFTTFMWPRIEDAHPSVAYFLAEPAFLRTAQLMGSPIATVRHLSLPNFYTDPTPPPPFESRPFDVFIPVTFRGIGDISAYRDSLQAEPDLREIAGALFDTLISDHFRYPLDGFLEVVEATMGIVAPDLSADRVRLKRFLAVLSAVDMIVRNTRRTDQVRALLADAAGLRIQIAGKLPDTLDLPPGTVANGPMTAPEIGRAMAQSRIVIHSHPTYPGAMHERVPTAMAAGCVVISDPAPALSDAFIENSTWLCPPDGATLRDLTASLGPDGLAAIGARAAGCAPGPFGIGPHVDALLTGLDAQEL